MCVLITSAVLKVVKISLAVESKVSVSVTATPLFTSAIKVKAYV